MEQTTIQEAGQPMIVKYVENARTGVQSLHLSRYAVGYVVRGVKYIHYGDKRVRLERGHVFYLGIGNHYTEDVPDEGHAFEQIVFYYSPDELQRILLHLNITYRMTISNNHSCEECRTRSSVFMPAWTSLRNFFQSANNYLRDEMFLCDAAAENIKMTELIYHLVAHDDCCLKSKLLSNIDSAKENFEQTVYAHVFRECSIEELAQQTNRSLTSFKKEFRRLFHMPPHKWFISQRLMHSRLLLISTSKSISEIGIECTFPNTSHFIKLFKKQFGLTPATYRARHLASQREEQAATIPAAELTAPCEEPVAEESIAL